MTGGPRAAGRSLARLGAALLALAVLLAAAAFPAAAAPAQDPDTVTRQREELRARLSALRKEIAAGEASRSEASDALRESEQAISDANRRLAELGGEQKTAQAALDAIRSQEASVQADVTARQTQIARLLHKEYLSGGESPLKAFLSGSDPNQAGRDAAYLGYISAAQARLIADLRARQSELVALEASAREKQDELARIGREQAAERETLVRQQQARKKVLADLSARLAAQRKEAGALARDEQRLSRVIDRLTRIIAERARRQKAEEERARREAQKLALAARRERRAVRPPAETETAPSTPSLRNEATPDGSLAGAFAKLKGRLRLPVAGDLVGRFGASRGEGGTSWKGVFIRAAAGSEVKAVAAGRVVYAEWLRGFGNLLILDHGDQYLSIYGNNETLLKQPGDVVKAGDTIAHVGTSGGNAEPGLYFELRYRGQPFDPLKWAALR